jgi:gluconate 2-dehydrogenase gamma chain
VKRRHFLRWSMGGLLLGNAGLAGARAWVPDFSAIRLEATGLDASQWALIAVVQEHLLPAEEHAPGAGEVNAATWLQWVLSGPEAQEAERLFFRQGAEELARLSQKEYRKEFQFLSTEERETLLRKFEAEAGGHGWLRELLNYLMEAMLTDPVYGGNPNQVGWKWLEHKPGYKRPPADKRYFLL